MQSFVPVPRSLLSSPKFQKQSIRAQFLFILFLSKDYGEHAEKGDIYLKAVDYEPFMCRNTYFKALEELIQAGLLKVTRTVRTVNGATRRLFTIPFLIGDRVEQYQVVNGTGHSEVLDSSSGGTGTVHPLNHPVPCSGATSETPLETQEETPRETKEETPVIKDLKDSKGMWIPDDPDDDSFFFFAESTAAPSIKVGSEGNPTRQSGDTISAIVKTNTPTPIHNSDAQGNSATRATAAKPYSMPLLGPTNLRAVRTQCHGGLKLHWDPNDPPLPKAFADENLLPEELQAYLESRKPSGIMWANQSPSTTGNWLQRSTGSLSGLQFQQEVD